MTSFRYEHKFLVPKMCEGEVLSLIRLHPAGFSPLYHPRRINNIYLDGHDWQCYLATADGQSQRVKVRIRWYGGLFEEIKKPVLELKYKIGFVSKKKSFPLTPFVLDEHFTQKMLHTVFSASDLPPFLHHDLLQLECRLFNTYFREYFISHDKIFRITLDSAMEFLSIHPHKNTFATRRKNNADIVMELKYDVEHNARAPHITNHFPYRLSKNSKYSVGIESLYQ